MLNWVVMFLELAAMSMLSASLWLFLRRHGVDPLKPLCNLRKYTFGRILWIALFVVCAIHQGATKLADGLSGAPPSGTTLQMIVPELDAVQGPDAIFPVCADPVTSLVFTGILNLPVSNAVYLGVAWPSNALLPYSCLDIFAKHDLATNDWEVVGSVSVDTNLVFATVEVPYSVLPDGFGKSMFFRVGSYVDSDGDGLSDAFEHMVAHSNSQLPDSDQDGLDDGEEFACGLNPGISDTDGDNIEDVDEVGVVRRLQGFEWYDLTGCAQSFGREQGLGSYLGASLTVDFTASVNLRGIECLGAVMFDNGYVSIRSSGDFNGWVFPEIPMPLAHAYNSGSFLVAPYWKSSLMAQYGDTNSFLRAGHIAADGVTVLEFHDLRNGASSSGGMTFQVIVPDGTGNVVRVSYLSSDVWMDGAGAVVGVHNKRCVTTNGCYNLTWDFDRMGPILPGTTVEYHFGTGTDPCLVDSDGDGIHDGVEVYVVGTNPLMTDTDSDGLEDGFELQLGTSPVRSDTDLDGMPDMWELTYRLSPTDSADALQDADSDGLSNLAEYNHGTSPDVGDTDADGLVDGIEVNAYGTDPTMADTDDDGLSDMAEIQLSLNPNAIDSDGDGMPDGWEVGNGLDASCGTGDDGSSGDPDHDGLCNLQEFQLGSNPQEADSDGDGVSDYQEICNGSNPSDGTDHGKATVGFPYRGMRFNVYGDYAAWRMTVAGAGPLDNTADTVSMESPGQGNEKLKILKKGNSYNLSMTWLNSDGHTNPSWYCWQATINGLPTTPTYQSCHSTRLAGNEIVYDVGWMAENADGLLTSHVHMHDPVNGYGGGNVAEGLAATLHVYKCAVTICNPDDDSWPELEESRVLLDNETLRIKVKIEPAIDTFEHCRLVMGSNVTVSTSGTCPNGVNVQITASDFSNHDSYSEIKIARTRQQLIELGLLPPQNDDVDDERSAFDVGNDTDSMAFLNGASHVRGMAVEDVTRYIDTYSFSARCSASFFRAAGVEVVMVSFAGSHAYSRKIMNQADVFYYSGHGRSTDGNLLGPSSQVYGLCPSTVLGWWNRDLDCVIFSACSVLDINDYNNNYGDPSGRYSHGKEWEQTGPSVLLGYNAVAPGDSGGATTRIVNDWKIRRFDGDINAWMEANRINRAWNACAIEKGIRYVYFRKGLFGRHKVVSVLKGDW